MKIKPYDIEMMQGKPKKDHSDDVRCISARSDGKSFTRLAQRIGEIYNIPPNEVLKLIYECQCESN